VTRLSDAILIGSTVVKAKPGRQYSMKEKSGCAIGMAIVGAGGRFVPRAPGPPMVYRSDGLEWWSWTINLETRPCRCRIVAEAAGRMWPCLRSFWLRKMPVKDIITHLFDCHVFGKGDWTIERLAEWVASVEPRKNEPVTPQPKPVAPPESHHARDRRADLSAQQSAIKDELERIITLRRLLRHRRGDRLNAKSLLGPATRAAIRSRQKSPAWSDRFSIYS
jgi:hypothetical protein